MADTSAVFFLTLFFNFVSLCFSTTEEVEVSCAVGSDCVLPCSFMSGSHIFIHWRRTPGSGIVHSYYRNQNQLQQQHRDYSGRTFLFQRIHQGDASLLLKEVRVQDEGSYMCITSTSSDSSITTMNLKVFVSSFVVNVEKQDSELVCHAEGVYPEPAVAWITGLSVNQGRTTVRQREDQLYDIHSSVTLQSAFTVFSCNVSTAHYWKSTDITEEYPVGVFYSDAVLRCPAAKVPTKSLIWTFNHTQRILTRAGSELVFNETWGPFVDALTMSNSLVLKDLTQDQEGFYSCRLNTDRRTFVTVIHLKIQLMQLYHEITENTAAESELMIVWIMGALMGALISYGISFCCFGNKVDSSETQKKEDDAGV